MSTAESRPASEPVMLVVMGVSGSGKSTVAAQVAGRIGAIYVDGDDLHPPENVAKMRSGTPLTNSDRWPWLDRVARELVDKRAQQQGIIVACSALKRAYRDRLREGTGGNVRFIFLDASFEVIDARLAKQIHHFMPEALLRSQFATLQRPSADEIDVVTVQVDQSPEQVTADIVASLGQQAG